MKNNIAVNYTPAGKKDCPATPFRKYIEDKLNGEKPKRVFISDECVKFFINDSIVDYMGYIDDQQKEFEFLWNESEIYPSLIIRIRLDEETGQFLLTYMKEDAKNDAPEFIWDEQNANENGLDLVLSYAYDDALEELVDMDEYVIK